MQVRLKVERLHAHPRYHHSYLYILEEHGGTLILPLPTSYLYPCKEDLSASLESPILIYFTGVLLGWREIR